MKSFKLETIKEIICEVLSTMVEEVNGPKKIKSEELISRFRSKEDLYKYLNQQGKIFTQ
jgi:hypothetical protein